MKKAIIGSALLVAGTIGFQAQRIVDTIFVASGFRAGGGFNLLLNGGICIFIVGAVLCVLALKDQNER